MDATTTTTEKAKGRQARPKPETKVESKRERFVAGAQMRTNNAIKVIRGIGKLANSSKYEYGESDVRKIAAALAREVDNLKLRMTETRGASGAGFVL